MNKLYEKYLGWRLKVIQKEISFLEKLNSCYQIDNAKPVNVDILSPTMIGLHFFLERERNYDADNRLNKLTKRQSKLKGIIQNAI